MQREQQFLMFAERYRFDSGMCHFSKGFAQVDSEQDAPYYGQWANPIERKYVCFAEGDLDIMTFDNADEFAKHIREVAAMDCFKGIDGMCSEPIIEGFKAIGLGDLLH